MRSTHQQSHNFNRPKGRTARSSDLLFTLEIVSLVKMARLTELFFLCMYLVVEKMRLRRKTVRPSRKDIAWCGPRSLPVRACGFCTLPYDVTLSHQVADRYFKLKR